MSCICSCFCPPCTYQVYLVEVDEAGCQKVTYTSQKKARDAYAKLIQYQKLIRNDSVVALIANDTLIQASHGQLTRFGDERPTHIYRTYHSLSSELRHNARLVWQRVELRNVR